VGSGVSLESQLKGEVEGIIIYLEALHPDLSKTGLLNKFREALVLIGRDNEDINYWCQEYFKDVFEIVFEIYQKDVLGNIRLFETRTFPNGSEVLEYCRLLGNDNFKYFPNIVVTSEVNDV
jgi:hypothetical protein